jgi:glycine cleavage system H protein
VLVAIPEELRYTSEHEWVRPSGDGAGVRVGITDFAQDALGDIVYVQLPEAGTAVRAGQPLGEVESTKSVSEIYAPVDGTVVARNDALGDTPELINDDPYGAGWLVDIEPADPTALDDLLDAEAYAELTNTGN